LRVSIAGPIIFTPLFAICLTNRILSAFIQFLLYMAAIVERARASAGEQAAGSKTIYSNCEFTNPTPMAEAVGAALGSGVAAAKAVFDDRGEVAGLLPLYAASIINLKVLLNAMKLEAERVNPMDALLRAQIDGTV
jgi:hypothetical protein